jgi:hypothetical protein
LRTWIPAFLNLWILNHANNHSEIIYNYTILIDGKLLFLGADDLCSSPGLILTRNLAAFPLITLHVPPGGIPMRAPRPRRSPHARAAQRAIMVTEYKIAHYKCPCCLKEVVAKDPSCPREGKFGNNVIAVATVLKYEERLPHRKIHDAMVRLYI